MVRHPPVSCICLTYARPALLEEAIYSFLLQAYAGTKELIVLNDYDGQQLECDHPEVRVFNLPKRLHTVGEKMNMAAALASHDLLFVWDDDDVYLPHRLAFSVERLQVEQGFFKPDKAWVWDGGTLRGPASNIFHAGSCWTRARFDAVGGYAVEGTGYDWEFETRLARRFPGAITPYDITPEEIYYIYRWGGTGSYHMSGFGDAGDDHDYYDSSAYHDHDGVHDRGPTHYYGSAHDPEHGRTAVVVPVAGICPPMYVPPTISYVEDGQKMFGQCSLGAHRRPMVMALLQRLADMHARAWGDGDADSGRGGAALPQVNVWLSASRAHARARVRIQPMQRCERCSTAGREHGWPPGPDRLHVGTVSPGPPHA